MYNDRRWKDWPRAAVSVLVLPQCCLSLLWCAAKCHVHRAPWLIHQPFRKGSPKFFLRVTPPGADGRRFLRCAYQLLMRVFLQAVRLVCRAVVTKDTALTKIAMSLRQRLIRLRHSLHIEHTDIQFPPFRESVPVIFSSLFVYRQLVK